MHSTHATLLTLLLSAIGLVGAAEPARGGPAPELTYRDGRLHLAPPPGATVTQYVLQYTTPERLAAGERWGIWAKQWPATVTDINLADAQSQAGCEALGPGAVCFRPEALGEHAAGATRIYRAYAQIDGHWSAPSANLTVTRP